MLICIAFAVLVSFLSASLMPEQVYVEIGQESPVTVYAPRDVIDHKATEDKRDQAAQSVPDVYLRDRSIEERVYTDVENVFRVLQEARAENLRGKRLREFFMTHLDTGLRERLEELDQEVLETGVSFNDEELAVLQSETFGVLQKTFDEVVQSMNSATTLIDHYVNLLDRPLRERNFIRAVAVSVFVPNQTKDEDATQALRKEARANVQSVYVRKGDLVVRKGQFVTERAYLILEELGMLRRGPDYSLIVGIAMYVLLVLVVWGIYLQLFERETYANFTHLVILALIAVITVILGKIVMAFTGGGYLIPLAGAAMLITVLISARVAFASTLAIGFLVALLVDGGLNYLLVMLVSSLIAVYSVSHMRQRSDILRAGVYLGAVNAVAIISLHLIGETIVRVMLYEAALGALSGLVSTVLALGLLPLFETVFGVTSVVKLLELSNPNQQLLRKLLTEAPGTYHHSILVGNLAEAAAEEVGADPLLARVGAYYHDIGKTKRPYFFIENQFTAENPHDKYSPSLSTLIITSHVKDGVEMAREAKLPPKVIDIIEQHHGTTLVRYFYHNALEEGKEGAVREDDFRYDGPKPQSKEAAIVMLADSVEAAVRALPQPTPGKIEGLVRKIIKERLDTGQLDECDLTLQDLDRLATAFVHILTGIFHNRIEYPERSIADLERSRRISGAINK